MLQVAVAWAYRAMAISASMALPALGGYWLDTKLGTKIVFLCLGAAVGMALGMVLLLGLVRRKPSVTQRKPGGEQGSSSSETKLPF